MINRVTRLAVLAAVSVLAFTGTAHAAGITLSRDPAPPEAVKNDGTGKVAYNYTITWESSLTPSLRQTRIWRGQPGASGSTVVHTTFPQSMVGALSPYIANTETYTVPAAAAPGSYYVETIFYTTQSCGGVCPPIPDPDLDFEARASVQFSVAASTGTITVRKFEDLNGNGIRDSGEPGVPAWPFQVIAPNADLVGTSTHSRSTTGNGTFTLADVPAGPGVKYHISEILPNPNPSDWAPTTPADRTVELTDGASHVVEFGNARKALLCGTTWNDSNGNGQHDPDETPFAGVHVALGGGDGLGQKVSDTKVTDARGRYCFGPLMPGTYRVLMHTPDGYRATWDKDGEGNGLTLISPITLTSGQPSDGNDFGLYQPKEILPPPPAPAPRRQPQTRLCLSKKASKKKVRQGGAVKWTVRVKNCGRHVARGVAIIDPFMADTTLGSRSRAALVRGSLVWNVGRLKVNATKTVTFITRFDRDARVGRHRNRARAEAENARTVRATAFTKVMRKPRPPKRIAVTG